MFLTNLFLSFLIFRFSSVSCLEQLNNDLCQAATVGNVKMVKCILSCGVSANVHYDVLNLTPLFNAVQKNSAEAAQLLLECGAKIKARDVNNLTSLHYAVENNNRTSAQLLLERDAETKARNVINVIPL